MVDQISTCIPDFTYIQQKQVFKQNFTVRKVNSSQTFIKGIKNLHCSNSGQQVAQAHQGWCVVSLMIDRQTSRYRVDTVREYLRFGHSSKPNGIVVMGWGKD